MLGRDRKKDKKYAMSRHHVIEPTPENMIYGFFDAALPPILEVDSGDTVTLTSWPAGGLDSLPADRSRVLQAHLDAYEQSPGNGPHFVTGPIYVRGAVPGDVLQIDILSHE